MKEIGASQKVTIAIRCNLGKISLARLFFIQFLCLSTSLFYALFYAVSSGLTQIKIAQTF
jgi:hypothetical protein